MKLKLKEIIGAERLKEQSDEKRAHVARRLVDVVQEELKVESIELDMKK